MTDLKKYSSENRAINDFLKIYNFSKSKDEKFAVICVDVQRGFFSNVFMKNKKLSGFINYLRKVKELCLKNEILFFDVTNKQTIGKSVLSEENNFSKVINISKKSNSAMYDTEVFEQLSKNDISNVFVVGLFRNRCILATITDLIKRDKFTIITSYLGTLNFHDSLEKRESRKSEIKKYIDKDLINYDNEYPNYFENVHQEMGGEKYKFSNEIKFLRQNGVLILDYYYKGNNGKFTCDLDDFSR